MVDWSARYPRPLLDKLGLKPGARVTILGVEDEAFGQAVRERTADVSTRLRKDSDLVFYAANRLRDLDRLGALRVGLKSAGAIWVVRIKGDAAVIKETDIIAAAKTQGLVDIKVVSFSDEYSAEKFVIPVAKRTRS